MAYTSATLSQIAGTIEGNWKEWVYTTADSLATVKGAAYISDATNRGMEVGDFVRVVNTGTPAYALYVVNAINGSGAATLTGSIVVT